MAAPADRTPRAAGRRIGIIGLVPDRWKSVWMPRHYVLSRLAADFEVVWIEPARGWRESWLPAESDDPYVAAETSGTPGLTVYDPGRRFPDVYKPALLGRWLRHGRVRAARRILKRKGCRQIVLYIWRPEFDWALDACAADLTLYHIDDEYQFSRDDQPNDPREERLIRAVDQVVIHSPALLRKKGSLNPETIHVPNGVDFKAFSQPRPEPADMAAIARPRIGYIGVIKTQLNLRLLLDLTHKRRDWSFVLVGPRGFLGEKAPLIAELERQPNVHFLGGRPHGELPAYAQHMDVCTMFYEIDGYTKYIYPLKLNEYLATGRPVVAAPIDALLQYRGVVQLADDLADWEAAIAASLQPAAMEPRLVTQRLEVARQNDWDTLVAKIAGQIHQRLAAPAAPGRHD